MHPSPLASGLGLERGDDGALDGEMVSRIVFNGVNRGTGDERQTGITAQFIAGDQQRDINARDIEAWKKVAIDAKIEVK